MSGECSGHILDCHAAAGSRASAPPPTRNVPECLARLSEAVSPMARSSPTSRHRRHARCSSAMQSHWRTVLASRTFAPQLARDL
eukprot:5692018-Prymnesium_polylepis.1